MAGGADRIAGGGGGGAGECHACHGDVGSAQRRLWGGRMGGTRGPAMSPEWNVEADPREVGAVDTDEGHHPARRLNR